MNQVEQIMKMKKTIERLCHDEEWQTLYNFVNENIIVDLETLNILGRNINNLQSPRSLFECFYFIDDYGNHLFNMIKKNNGYTFINIIISGGNCILQNHFVNERVIYWLKETREDDDNYTAKQKKNLFDKLYQNPKYCNIFAEMDKREENTKKQYTESMSTVTTDTADVNKDSW